MGFGSQDDGSQQARGFGKRGAVKLAPAGRKPGPRNAPADNMSGRPSSRISYHQDRQPDDTEEAELERRLGKTTLRNRLLAGGALIVAVPLVTGLLSGPPGESTGGSGSTRVPIVVPHGGSGTGEHSVSRGGFGATGASPHFSGAGS